MSTWQLQDAKNKFSKVLQEALKEPQFVTKHGTPAAVIMSIHDYRKSLKGQSSFKQFLCAAPLEKLDLKREDSDSRQDAF